MRARYIERVGEQVFGIHIDRSGGRNVLARAFVARDVFFGNGLFGRRDTDDGNGPRADTLGSFLGQFAQFLLLLGRGERLTAPATATAALLAVAGCDAGRRSGTDREAWFGEDVRTVDVDDADLDRVAGR